jgi:hypothetical protein
LKPNIKSASVLPKESKDTMAQYSWDGTYSSCQSTSSTEGIGPSVYRASSPDCPVDSIENTYSNQALSSPPQQLIWSGGDYATTNEAAQVAPAAYEAEYGQWTNALATKAATSSSAAAYDETTYYTAECSVLSPAPQEAQSSPELLNQMTTERPRSASFNFTGFHSLDHSTKSAILDALSREGREIHLSVV